MLLARGTFGGADFWWMGPSSGKSSINAWIKFLGKLRAAMLVWNSTSFHQGSPPPPPPQEDVWENCSNGRIMYEQIALFWLSWEWKKHRYITPMQAFQPPLHPNNPIPHIRHCSNFVFHYFLKQLFLITESFLSFVVKLNLLPLWMNCIPFGHVWKEIYGYSLLHF